MRRAVMLVALTLAAAGCSADDDAPSAPDAGCSEAVLTCAPAQTLACTGARTRAIVAAPSVDTRCAGGSVSAISDDAPASDYAVGATAVTFSASGANGERFSCRALVEVVDNAPPTITCPTAPISVVRLDATEPLALPVFRATDECDDAVTVVLDATPTGRGRTVTTANAIDDAGNTASCALTIDVFDLFPPSALRIVSASLSDAGATDVTLGWDASWGADVQRLAIERAATAAGPFAELARIPSSATTYTDAAMPPPRAFYRIVALGPGAVRGGESDILRVLAITDDRYELAAQTVPTVPFATTLYGVVRAPSELASDGPFPLVVFLHGNHGNCRPPTGDDVCVDTDEHACLEPGFTTTPNAEGYVYLMETLAASGYVAVSLSANALNCRDDFIPERTQLILEHLRRWQRWSTTTEAPFMGRYRGVIDMSRVAAVGHSRGGEAVSQLPAALRATPIAGVSLASVFAIAPTDYHDNSPEGVPYAVLLPSCDGDVRTLEGLRMYDRGLARVAAFPRAQVVVVGADHNFFNTEWRFDDNWAGAEPVCTSGLLGAPAQRGMLELTLADWLAATVLDAPMPRYVRSEEGSPRLMDFWAGRELELRWSYASSSRVIIDRFDSLATTASGRPSTFVGFTAATDCIGACAGAFPHLVSGARLAWQDATATARFDLGDLDVAAQAAVSVRFASRMARINDGLRDHDFTIRVRDTAGHSADILLSTVGRLPTAFASTDAAEILSTVRVRVQRIERVSPDLDVHHLASIELVMPVAGHAQGSVWVADLELAGD